MPHFEEQTSNERNARSSYGASALGFTSRASEKLVHPTMRAPTMYPHTRDCRAQYGSSNDHEPYAVQPPWSSNPPEMAQPSERLWTYLRPGELEELIEQSVHEAIKLLNEELASLRSDNAELREEIWHTRKAATSHLNKAREDMWQHVSASEQGFASRIDSVDRRSANVAHRTDYIDRDLAQAFRQLEALESKTGQVQSRVEDDWLYESERIGELEAFVRHLQKTIETMQSAKSVPTFEDTDRQVFGTFERPRHMQWEERHPLHSTLNSVRPHVEAGPGFRIGHRGPGR